MRKATQPIRNVAVVLKLAGASGRDILNGISTYAKEHCHRRLRIFSRSEDFTPASLQEMPNLDGIITSERGVDGVSDLLETSQVPLVVIGMKDDWLRRRTKHLLFVRNDDEDIGRFAANHLFSLGKFRSFGFVPHTERTYWSLLREKGFRASLRAKSEPVSVYDAKTSLRTWLATLPKPTAVFAAFDERAVDVLTACNEEGLRVPQQAAVIGVDNDELLCDFSEPPLSSILPDHVHEGSVAAQALDRLMRLRKATDGKTTLCRVKRLIRRESTAPIAPATHLIDEILRYVHRNATSGLRANDVVRHLGVSRRLVDLRLKEADEPPLARLIANSRLDEVARRLRETKSSVGQIASACAFGNLQHLANAFKRRFGKSMTAYRSSPSTNVSVSRSGRTI